MIRKEHSSVVLTGLSRGRQEHTGLISWTDGPQDLLEAAQKGLFRGDGYMSSWYGSESFMDSLVSGSQGSDKFVAQSEAMLDQINARMAVQTAGMVMDNAMAGFVPDVPAAIMGLPESMINLVDTQADHAPVTVWVNTTMSGGFDAASIARRGAGVAALILKLQAIRPVQLNIMVSLSRCNFVVCPIHARPLSIGQVSYLLCSAGWTRHVYSYLSAEHNAGGGWDSIFDAYGHDAQSAEYQKNMVEFLGGDVEHDIFIPPLFLHDQLAAKPAEWVAERLKRYYKQED